MPKEKNITPQITLTDGEKDRILQSAITNIINGNLGELDPVIGENACQMRAYTTIQIARKLLKSDELTEVEKDYLIGIKLLSLPPLTIHTYNTQGILIKDESSTKTLPEILDARQGMSGNAIKKLLLPLKHKIVNYAINRLKTNLEDHAELLAALGDVRIAARGDKEEILHCLPLLATGRAMFTLEKEAGNPILVTITRYRVTAHSEDIAETNTFLHDVTTLMFKPVEGEYELVRCPKEDDLILPALHYKTYNVIRDCDIGKPLYDSSRRSYINDIEEIGIEKLLLISHALHPQYPGTREGSSEATYEYENETLIGTLYASLIEDAGKLGIHNAALRHNGNDTGSVPFLVQHVYPSTLHEAKAKAKKLEQDAKDEVLERIKGLSVPCGGAGCDMEEINDAVADLVVSLEHDPAPHLMAGSDSIDMSCLSADELGTAILLAYAGASIGGMSR